jgi:hypothetical protein
MRNCAPPPGRCRGANETNSGYEFDNIADVLAVSPVLLERYRFTAGRVSRLDGGHA